MRSSLKTHDTKYVKMIQCDCGECRFEITQYRRQPERERKERNPRKSGALIYDQGKHHVLLVQSRGNLWGCPKGSPEDNEEFEEGAIREVREETGLTLNESELSNPIWISPSVVYFSVERIGVQDGHVQPKDGNDANGVVWIKVECLKTLLADGSMRITSHTRKALQILLGTELPRKTG